MRMDLQAPSIPGPVWRLPHERLPYVYRARNVGKEHFVIDLAFARCDARWGQLVNAVEAAARGLRRVGKEDDRRARLRSGVGVD